mgnify:CR=1 FL=1
MRRLLIFLIAWLCSSAIAQSQGTFVFVQVNESIQPLARAAKYEDPLDAALKQAKREIFTEEILSQGAYELVQAAAELPPAERYQHLKQYVMPSEDHTQIRLTCEQSPVNPPPMMATRGTLDREVLCCI